MLRPYSSCLVNFVSSLGRRRRRSWSTRTSRRSRGRRWGSGTGSGRSWLTPSSGDSSSSWTSWVPPLYRRRSWKRWDGYRFSSVEYSVASCVLLVIEAVSSVAICLSLSKNFVVTSMSFSNCNDKKGKAPSATVTSLEKDWLTGFFPTLLATLFTPVSIIF